MPLIEARWRHLGGGSIVDNVGPCGAEGVLRVILPKVRDPRFVTIRRGGTLTDPDHQLLALWAASCAEHVLDRFESVRPEDQRPRHAIEQTRAWARGDTTMSARMSSVPLPMRSRPHVLPRRKEKAIARVGSSAGGSAISSRRRSASSYSTTNGCETTSAGRCSTVEAVLGEPAMPPSCPFQDLRLMPDTER
jgi:hypothetical protein